MIIIITILASFALPKFYNTKTMASVAILKQDISTIITSLQTYSMTNGKINKITDAVNLSTSYWEVNDKKLIYKNNDLACIEIEIKNSSLQNNISLTITPSSGEICKKLNDSGIITSKFNLY